MGMIEDLAVQDFLRNRGSFIDGTIIAWDSMYPRDPMRAEILAIEEVFYDGCSDRDVVIFTDTFVPVADGPDSPRPMWRHFSFTMNPLTASICRVSSGLWVIAKSHEAVVHLHCR